MCYLSASGTAADSTINQFIPLAILAVLMTVVVITAIASVQELQEYWANR
jgi:hypothetical protein